MLNWCQYNNIDSYLRKIRDECEVLRQQDLTIQLGSSVHFIERQIEELQSIMFFLLED